MDGKYSRRSRYTQESLGSVKSRIQAREGFSPNEANDVSKVKQARQKVDARAFRNAEGVRSRLNKFSEKASASPATNGTPKSYRQKEEKVEQNGKVNGEVGSRINDRKIAAKENETESKRSAVSSKYSRENRFKKTESSKEETPDSRKKIEESVKKQEEVVEDKVEVKDIQVEDTCSPAKSEVVLDDDKPVDSIEEKTEDNASNTVSEEVSESMEKINETENKAVDEDFAESKEKTRSPAEESDFLSAFASPKVSQSKPTNEVESTTIDVKEDSAASRREKRMRNRRERSLEEEVSTPTEENVERNDVGKEKREMRLERLNDNSLDETPRRRRNRAQKALDSARSSADSSLVSTPDNDSAKVDLESRSKPTVESPDSETKAYSPSVTSQLDSPIPQSQEDAATSSNVDESVVVDEVTVSEPKPVETEEVDTYAVDDKPSSLPDEADAREPEAEQTPETKTEEVVDQQSDSSTNVVEEVKEDSSATPSEPTSNGEVQYTLDNVEECKDLNILERMLDKATVYEERKKIRGVIRALRRAGVTATTPKSTPSSTTSKWQSKTKTEVRTDRGTSRTTTTVKKEVKEVRTQRSGLSSSLHSNKENKTPPDPKSLAEKYGLSSETKEKSKKVGSIFDREEETPRKSSSRIDLERRQAERKREMMRNRAPPASASSKDARKKFVAKLEDEGGTKISSGISSKSPTSVVPNANNVKNMLLRWCQSKTRAYENVDISNYSTSWADGMAFCALTHNFFPDAFEFSELEPKNRAHNFNLAFNTAEERGDIPKLLDVSDLVRMSEPDWKCIYTYLTEFYKHIRELGMT